MRVPRTGGPRTGGPLTGGPWIALRVGLLAVAGCSASPVPGGHVLPHTVTAPRSGHMQAELDVVSGATTITVATASLGSRLLRASTPANSGVRPDLVVAGPVKDGAVNAGTVQVYLDQTGQSGPAALRILLNSGVTWQLTFSGGTSQTSVDLSAGRLRGADFAAGSNLITMRLPRPDGTVTIVLAGGASQVSLSIPAGVPARLRLEGGASSATVGGRSYTGIAGGTVLTMPGWATARQRYDIDAPAGVSAIMVG